MGRVLDALRQAEAPHDEPESRPQPAAVPAPAPGLAEGAEGETEIPFIEVGPRKSLEASPCVLACTPSALLAARAAETPAPAPARPAAPTPGTVAFRALGRPAGPCRSRIAAEVVAFHAPEQAPGAQYRDLLAAVTAAGPGPRPAALLFTPARADAEATAVVLNLAVTAARQGRRRVLAVDGNLRRPGVAWRLGLPEAPGLREVLGGAVTLDEAVQETEQPNLLALTAGAPAGGVGPRFVAETMRSLLRQLRQRFDLVLVDAPRWDGRTDAALLAACDAVYLVLPEKDAESPAVDELLQALPALGARLAGCVLAG
jgi:Mrp family chromosome partitioning ATPase